MLRHIISTETGNILIWNLRLHRVIFKTEQKDVKQIVLIEDDTKFLAVSRVSH